MEMLTQLTDTSPNMSGYPQGQGQGHGQGHQDYDDGYGAHGGQQGGQQGGNTDSYYQDDQQYYGNNAQGYDARGQQGEGYYDESCVHAP
jgi:1,3-beta-glucan synthase